MTWQAWTGWTGGSTGSAESAASGRHALRVREMRSKPGKGWPRLSWRRFAYRFLAASMLVLAFTDFADNQYGRPHPALLTAHWLQAVIIAGWLALRLAEDRYAKQIGKRRVGHAGGAGSGRVPGKSLERT